MRAKSLTGVRRTALGFALCLLVAEPSLGSTGPAAGAPASPPSNPSAPGPPASRTGPVLAAASTTPARTTTRRRRVRRRYRRQTLRLPAVTQYGIPRLHVKAAYVVDATNNRVLFQKNPERAFPIASLTKMMTALVFFRTNPDFDRVVEITREDVRNSSRSHLRPREEITVRDLLHAMIMSSDNVATKALVRTCGVPLDEYIAHMNSMADSLELLSAHFVDPTGLDERNVATATDCAKLLHLASSNPIIGAIMQKTDYDFTSNRRRHRLVNTNRLLRSKWRVTAGKTGFISEAGYCLATNVETQSGSEITAVLLGAPSNALRFAEARRLLDWSYRFGLARPEARASDD
jgi:D-alanyl-D-alanine endopeptidase (penicillin-binding protein 7)